MKLLQAGRDLGSGWEGPFPGIKLMPLSYFGQVKACLGFQTSQKEYFPSNVWLSLAIHKLSPPKTHFIIFPPQASSFEGLLSTKLCVGFFKILYELDMISRKENSSQQQKNLRFYTACLGKLTSVKI